MNRLQITEEFVESIKRPASVRFVSSVEASHTELVEIVKESVTLSGKDDPFLELTESCYAIAALAVADRTKKGTSNSVEFVPHEAALLSDGAELKFKRLIKLEEKHFSKDVGHSLSNKVLHDCRLFLDAATVKVGDGPNSDLIRTRLRKVSKTRFSASGEQGPLIHKLFKIMAEPQGLDLLALAIIWTTRSLAGINIDGLEILRLKERKFHRRLPERIALLLRCCLN